MAALVVLAYEGKGEVVPVQAIKAIALLIPNLGTR